MDYSHKLASIKSDTTLPISKVRPPYPWSYLKVEVVTTGGESQTHLLVT